MAELKPLPANPTNADIVASIAQMHVCIEAGFADVHKTFLEHDAKDNKNFALLNRKHLSLERVVRSNDKFSTARLDIIDKKADAVLNEQIKVKAALGVEAKKKPVGVLSQTRFIVTIFGAATAAGGIWRFIEYMFPTFALVFHQIHLYIIR